jgi:hypothetical protein
LQIGGTARAENSLPEDIAAALRAASDKLVTVSIEWTSQQQPAADIATLKGLQPGFGSPAMWALQTFRYDFDRGRYLAFARADAGIATKDGIYTGELEETEFQYSFNGSVIETGRTKTVLSRFRLDKLFSESPDARIMITNFWDSAGWRVPDLVADHVWFRDSHLSTIQSLPEYLLRHGFVVGDIVHDATVDTFSCVRLTLADKSRIYRIWLDPGLAFAIRRWRDRGQR